MSRSRTHEECGGEVERLISRSAFQLKGSGWYATDYAKSNGGGAKEDSKSSGDKSDSSKESKDSKDSKDSKGTDTKPAETKTSEAKSTPAPAANPSA